MICVEPPRSPTNVESVMISSRSVSIKWQHQMSDAAEVTKYIIQYKEGDGKLNYFIWKSQVIYV